MSEQESPSDPPDLLGGLYAELRGLAASHMARLAPGQTIQPTAVVHEAWLRVVGSGNSEWKSQSHFFAISVQAIRNVLVDEARKRGAQKRGGDHDRVTLSGLGDADGEPGTHVDLVDLSNAIDRLAELHERQAQIVDLRFFAGLSVAEVAEHLGVSERTVKGDWRMARAWLRMQLEG